MFSFIDKIIQAIARFFWVIVKWILEFFVFKLFRLKISDDKWQAFLQFIKFCIVGFSNTVISYVTYTVLLLVFQHAQILTGYDYLVAQGVAFVISVLWSFYCNRSFVFKAKDTTVWYLALIKTFISYSITGLFLNTVLLMLWVEVLHISEFIAPLINLVVTIPLNFILNKFWAFKKSKKKIDKTETEQ